MLTPVLNRRTGASRARSLGTTVEDVGRYVCRTCRSRACFEVDRRTDAARNRRSNVGPDGIVVPFVEESSRKLPKVGRQPADTLSTGQWTFCRRGSGVKGLRVYDDSREHDVNRTDLVTLAPNRTKKKPTHMYRRNRSA